MADDGWIQKLNIGNKIDFCPKHKQKQSLFRTATVQSITPNTVIVQLIHGEDSDTTDYSSDSELQSTLCVNINDTNDKRRIAPFNTKAVNLIKCQFVLNGHIGAIIPHFKYNNSILAIDVYTGRSYISQYNIHNNKWDHIADTNPFITSKHYTPILDINTNKIYFLYTSRKTYLKPPETLFVVFDINSLEWNRLRTNECKLFKHTLLNQDESSSQVTFLQERSGVDACLVNSSEIYILNRESDLIKLTVDEENKSGNFEVIFKGLQEHYGIMYSDSLGQIITFTEDYIVCYDVKCKKWKQCKHKLPVTLYEFTYTLIYDHIVVMFEESKIWFHDLLLERVFESKKCMPEMWLIVEMVAININNEFIHLLRRFNAPLFGCSWRHVKLLVDDIIPQKLVELYLRRKEMLCVGFLTKLTKLAVPKDIVNLIASFFIFLN